MNENDDTKLIGIVVHGSFTLFTYTMFDDLIILSIQSNSAIEQPHTLTTYSEFGITLKLLSTAEGKDLYEFLLGDFPEEMQQHERQYGRILTGKSSPAEYDELSKRYHNLLLNQSVTLSKMEYTTRKSLQHIISSYGRRNGIKLRARFHDEGDLCDVTITRIE